MRLSQTPILRAHWKALANRNSPTGSASPLRWVSVGILVLPALTTAILTRDVTNRYDTAVPAAVMSGAALLVGGLLAAFGVLTTWRSELHARAPEFPNKERALRGLVDEAVAHIMLAVVWAALLILLAIPLMALSGRPASIALAFSVGFGFHIVFLVLLIVPNLYSAYGQVMDVEESIDGYSSTRG